MKPRLFLWRYTAFATGEQELAFNVMSALLDGRATSFTRSSERCYKRKTGSGASVPLSAAEAVLGQALAAGVQVAAERESPAPRLNWAGQVDLIAAELAGPLSLAPLATEHSDAAGGCGAAPTAVLPGIRLDSQPPAKGGGDPERPG